jgi:hypothetical protein
MVKGRTARRHPPPGLGSAADVDHSPFMDLAHWIGVALATPAAAVVLLASWRTYSEGRSDDA